MMNFFKVAHPHGARNESKSVSPYGVSYGNMYLLNGMVSMEIITNRRFRYQTAFIMFGIDN